MNMATRLAEERRARLAAERLLELKQAELRAANKKLGAHALQLSHEINETRAEVAEVRDENRRVITQLGEATQKIELVEDQLWKALKTVRDGFAMFNAKNRLEIANPAYMAIFEGLECIDVGSTYAEVLQLMAEEGLVDLQGESSEEWQARMYERWATSPIPPETIRLWNGRFIKIQDRRTPDGGVVSLCVDLTELMRMWSAIEELPDGFVLYDDEDRLVMCNEPYRSIYSASAPAIVPGTAFEDILRYGLERGQYAAAVGREEEWLDERLNAHRFANRELEQQLNDGRWLRVYERETRGGGRVGLRVDITQIKKDQQRLKEATTRAEAANRAKSAFLANMSHEIRTPMNGVVGMADLMSETDLSEDQRLYLDTIRSSGEALLVIINDILDYSKIEADKLELHPEPFDLERAIHEVVMLLQPTARDKDLQLLVDFDMFLPTRFVGDPGRIRQILTNILGNAVKFTVEGHVLIRVVGMIADNGPSAIHITIEDTGIGIPEDKIDHVFGEFNQVEDEQNRKFEGTGLGLAITKRLIQMMDGDVWVESELGKGSCFGMRIMLDTDEPGGFERTALPGHLKRVLVVDDHSAHRSILSRQLEILGLQAEFCTTGSDAIDKLTNPPDLLICEEDLPDMMGHELATQIQTEGQTIPVVLLANYAVQISAENQNGIHAVLQKPTTRRQLLTALETVGPAERKKPKIEQVSPRKAGGQQETEDSGPPIDVLVAEDNKTNQLVFRKMASAFNVSLRFANNGLEAVEEYQKQRPDLIFMDISMPLMDGKQATREIRAIEDGGLRVPIVAVTAHAMAGDKETILEAGLDDYLTKPLRKAELGEKIRIFRNVVSQALAS
ncbi:hybrid sensor histidine kinase/response regulator [Pacificoceanicola onchidii]|uniref:hybrid sensor histidine kinase/response regulator n=1 Tax=Pacificoceanicola onchidii TaxID=2562685 RepID=UPI0010A5D42F|nr:response regulator [Pacificoceanicola onchidii]